MTEQRPLRDIVAERLWQVWRVSSIAPEWARDPTCTWEWLTANAATRAAAQEIRVTALFEADQAIETVCAELEARALDSFGEWEVSVVQRLKRCAIGETTPHLAPPSAPAQPAAPAPGPAPMELILAERRRQIEEEGWTPEHDDQHDDGSLLRAAVIYYRHAVHGDVQIRMDGAPLGWPWDRSWWKPRDARADLVRAGALCVAEKERLGRKSPNQGSSHVDHKLNLIVQALEQTP